MDNNNFLAPFSSDDLIAFFYFTKVSYKARVRGAAEKKNGEKLENVFVWSPDYKDSWQPLGLHLAFQFLL